MKADWTDEEILAYDFRYRGGRPDNDLTLRRERPALAGGVRFIQDYEITPPSDLPNRHRMVPYVWCALCQKPTHWIGWFAEDIDTGERFLVGKNCAAKHGAVFVRAGNLFNRLAARQRLLRRRQAFLERSPAIIAELHQWASSPAVKAAGVWLKDFGEAMPFLADELRAASRTAPPAMLVARRVRDHAAEARLERSRQERVIYRTVYESMGAPPCPAAFASGGPWSRICELYRRVDRVRSQLESSAPADHRMRELFASVADIDRQVQAIADDFKGFEDLGRPESWVRVLSWANADGPYYKLTGRRLTQRHRDARWSITPLDPVAPSELLVDMTEDLVRALAEAAAEPNRRSAAA